VRSLLRLTRPLAALAPVLALTTARAPAARAQRPELPPVSRELARLVPPTPAPAGFIADVPDVIPAADQARLDGEIRALQSAGAGDIGVAILPSIEDRAPVDVAVAIYRTWRIGRIDSLGSARRNLGALLLIVPKELAPDRRGQCWISTGTGAEGALTDAQSARICQDSIIPHLRERDYAAAVGAGIHAIGARLEAQAAEAGDTVGSAGGPTPARPSRAPWRWLLGAIASAVVALVGAFRWRRLHPRDCPVCGLRMQRLSEAADDAELNAGQRLEESLHSVDYDVWRCPAGHTARRGTRWRPSRAIRPSRTPRPTPWCSSR